MNIENDEESIGLINSLLDGLNQAGYIKQGSKIEVVYVASGGQHVDNIQTQYITTPSVSSVRQTTTDNTQTELPEMLKSAEAMALWKKVQDAGYIDKHYQPTLSRTQSALLANAMAKQLGIKEKWKLFGELWNRKNMYRDYYQALNQSQSLEFQDKLKRLFH